MYDIPSNKNLNLPKLFIYFNSQKPTQPRGTVPGIFTM